MGTHTDSRILKIHLGTTLLLLKFLSAKIEGLQQHDLVKNNVKYINPTTRIKRQVYYNTYVSIINKLTLTNWLIFNLLSIST